MKKFLNALSRPGQGRGLLALSVSSLFFLLAGVTANAQQISGTPGSPSTTTMDEEQNPGRNVYFGELHIHSSWSIDAYVFDTRIGPEDATKYAMGQPVIHPGGFQVQLEQPLDFTVVMDHSEYTGAFAMADDPNSPLRKNSPLMAELLRFGAWANGMDLYKLLSVTIVKDKPIKELQGPEVAGYAWKQIVKIADTYYQPGKRAANLPLRWSSVASGADGDGRVHRLCFVGYSRDILRLGFGPGPRTHSDGDHLHPYFGPPGLPTNSLSDSYEHLCKRRPAPQAWLEGSPLTSSSTASLSCCSGVSSTVSCSKVEAKYSQPS